MTRYEELRIGRRTVEPARPGKVLFPDDGLTKADLPGYYHRVAGRMLPHLRGRPLMLELHPEGIDDSGFMQKEIPDHFPDRVSHAVPPRKDGTVDYVLCEDTASLVHLAGQACVTPHRWLSRADRPDHPDRLVFGLDPPDDDYAPVWRAAGLLRALLDEVGLPSLPMTTGSRGLHVVVPLLRRDAFDEVQAFAGAVAGLLTARHPGGLTT